MYEDAKTMSSIKKRISNKISLRIMRGTVIENTNYCSKQDGKIHTNMIFRKPIIDIFDTVEMYTWQKKYIELIKTKQDDRTINWYYEKKGGMGKSALTRHMILKHNALAISGNKRDIKYAITEWNKTKDVTTVIIDIARSQYSNISYGAIEEIKNGFFFNGKYESCMVQFNPPHVIVFANSEPDYSMMSMDRWNIISLE